jgi:DNA invertase Pin-like site-specific DNA recombinase
MATPNRLKEIEIERGESCETLIPRLVNDLGTVEATARELETTSRTILRWLQANGYKRKVKIVWQRAKSLASQKQAQVSA